MQTSVQSPCKGGSRLCETTKAINAAIYKELYIFNWYQFWIPNVREQM